MEIEVQDHGRYRDVTPLSSGIVNNNHLSNINIQYNHGMSKLPEVNDSERVVKELENRVRTIKQENKHLRSKINTYGDSSDNVNPDDKLRSLMDNN